MADLKLNVLTGDIDLNNGYLSLITGADEKLQRIVLGLSINLGEFFTHTNHGLPWIYDETFDTDYEYRYMLTDQGGDTEYFIKNTLDKYLERLDFVEKVNSTYSFNPNTRVYNYKYSIQDVNGEVIEFPEYSVNL